MKESVLKIIQQLDDHVGVHTTDVAKRLQEDGTLDPQLTIYHAVDRIEATVQELVEEGKIALAPGTINTYHAV